jgi:hypothetical protein
MTDSQRRNLFHRLTSNDRTLEELAISPNGSDFFPTDNKTWLALGGCLGQNETVTTLSISFPVGLNFSDHRRQFQWLDCIASGLQLNTSIRFLCFANVHFSEHSAFFVKMSSFWHHNTSLTTLRFHSCEFEEIEYCTLARAITASATIKNIFFTNIPMSVSDFIAVSSAFQGTLKRLFLRNCGLDHEHLDLMRKLWIVDGAAPDVVDLSCNDDVVSCKSIGLVVKAMKHLSLAETSVGNHGVQALVQGLLAETEYVQTSSLLTLNLEGTNLSDKACKSIKLALENDNSSLRQIHLGYNNISDKGIKLLAKGLKSNTCLQSLHLQGNDITEIGWITILKLTCNTSTIDATKQSNHTLELLTGPSNYFWITSIGKLINEILSINKQARKATNEQSLARKVAAATKITNLHLISLYDSKTTIVDYNDENLFPLILSFISKHYNSAVTRVDEIYALSAMNHIVQNKCNLFQSNRALVVPNPRRERPVCYSNRPIKRQREIRTESHRES